MSSNLATRLLEIYGANQSAEWNWFEDVLAYSNARLPQAVLIAGRRSADSLMVAAGLGTLNWVGEIQRSPANDHFVPVGSQGFHRGEHDKASFDQQPVEAGGAVSACLEAYRATGDDRWRKQAWRPSIGSWEVTICRSRCTIPSPVDAETVCTPSELMKTKEQNRLWLF